jgi:hypothetical protein
MYRTELAPKTRTAPSSAYSHGISIDIGATRMIFVTGQIAKTTSA